MTREDNQDWMKMDGLFEKKIFSEDYIGCTLSSLLPRGLWFTSRKESRPWTLGWQRLSKLKFKLPDMLAGFTCMCVQTKTHMGQKRHIGGVQNSPLQWKENDF